MLIINYLHFTTIFGCLSAFPHLYFMFVRESIDKSGVVSVKVITKVNDKSKLLKTIGGSRRKIDIIDFLKQGHRFIASFVG